MRDRLMRVLVRGALHNRAIVRWLGREGSPELDPQIGAVIELNRRFGGPKLESLPPDEARVVSAAMSPLDADLEPMARITDVRAGGVPVRVFEPRDAGPHWIVYFHGGGGVIGSVATSEPATRLIAALTRCTVASVDYRLGPEHRHPAAIDDALAAFDALLPRVRGKVAVAGDSFGGFLSAHVDRARRVAGVRAPDVQCLLYPIVDWTMAAPSIDRLADGYILTRDLLHWFRTHYLGDADRRAISPAFWSDLRGSAPAIVVTAGFDPLVDEGDAHAARLRDARVPVRHHRYPSLIHAFLSLAGGVRAARAAVDAVCADLADMLA